VTFYFVVGLYGVEFSLNSYDILMNRRILISFRIFAGDFSFPWFKYRIAVSHGILSFELGHDKLQSHWIAQGPLKKVRLTTS
jgi:hypothetical protein